jgi:autotransporter-associated beta strand protein
MLTRLDKSGDGVVSLTNANTYANGTFVQAGTLLVGNSSGSATGSGKVDVFSGATLGGSGRISGPVNIMAGGNLSPGNSAGTLTIVDGSINGSLLMDVSDVASDRLVVTGALALGSGSNLNVVLNSDPAGLGQLVLIDMQGAGSISGAFASINGSPLSAQNTFTASYGGKEYQFSMSYTGGDGNDLVIAVPEPSIAMMAAGTFVGALGLRRRRR